MYKVLVVFLLTMLLYCHDVLPQGVGANYLVDGVGRIRSVEGIWYIEHLLENDSMIGIGGSTFRWHTLGRDHLALGLGNTLDEAPVFQLMLNSQVGLSSMSVTEFIINPTLRIRSADPLEPSKYVEMFHDQSLGFIHSHYGGVGLWSRNSVVSFGTGFSSFSEYFQISGNTGRKQTEFWTHTAYGNLIVISNANRRYTNFDFNSGLPEPTPTVYVHSGTSNKAEWIKITHNTINGSLDTGKGHVDFPKGFGATALSTDPVNPQNNQFVIWQSDGADSGDDGDIMIKITDSNGNSKTATFIDFSEL